MQLVHVAVPHENPCSDPAVELRLHCALLEQPPFEPPNATRFLVSAEAAGIPVTLVLNKADLLPADELERLVDQVTIYWRC